MRAGGVLCGRARPWRAIGFALVLGLFGFGVGIVEARGVSPTGEGSGPTREQVPVLAGTTLSGERVQLPKDLEQGGRSAVLVVGFGRGASGAAREWGRHLAEDTASLPTTTYFVLPVMTGVPSFLRGTVLRAIGRSVSPNGRRHFLPILSDEAGWRQVAGTYDDSVPYVLLVDGTGTVHWRGTGAFSAEMYKALRDEVAVLGREPQGTPDTGAVLP